MNEEDYKKIRSIFSEKGLEEGPFKIKAEEDVSINISCEKDHIDIDFSDSDKLPELSIRIINAGVDGITLGNKGGKIRLNSFPDIPFLYKWLK
jgi:DUF4097 and DUF4098 domain-containing protein YvlB